MGTGNLDEIFAPEPDIPENIRDDVVAKLNQMKEFVKNRPADFEWGLKDFEIGCKLGSGKFGRVYLVRDIHAHLPWALKLMHKSEIIKNNVQLQVRREIEIQSHLRHPNILTLHTYFDDARFIFLVLDYAGGGELYKKLNNSPNGYFPAATAARYLYQVVSALKYCHERRVIHRDLKPENILLDEDDNIKLSDFGWSVHAPSSSRRTLCGTLDYLPPEMVAHETYSAKVDNWCLGILCYEFLTGKPPFESQTTQATYAKIRALEYTFPDHVPAGARNLIQGLLRLRGQERLTFEDVQNHPWILQNYPKSFRTEDW